MEADLESVAEEIFLANPDKVDQAKKNASLAGWFVGQIMKESDGKFYFIDVVEKVNEKLMGN